MKDIKGFCRKKLIPGVNPVFLQGTIRDAEF